MLNDKNPASNQVLCAFGQSVKSGIVRPLAFQSLRGFAQWLKNLPPISEKLDSDYIVGATFTGRQRILADMLGATMIQLDFDKPLNPEHQQNVCSMLEFLDVAHVSFNSFSGCHKFVTLIPLSRPASAEEHRATVEWLMRELGQYATGLDEASYNPVLPRFVSPNSAATSARTVTVFEATTLEPVRAADEGELPANVTRLTPSPIPSKPAVADSFAMYAEQANPRDKELFLIALRENLLPVERLSEYPRWFPLVFACFRAWAINSRTLTGEQKEMWEALDAWSKLHPKWKPDALNVKLNDWLRDRGQGTSTLCIQSVLKCEVDHNRLRKAISSDSALGFDDACDLANAIDNVGGEAVTPIDDEALAAATAKMAAEDAAAKALELRGLTILARAPLVNARFNEFMNIVTAFSTQNKQDLWELDEDSWEHFLRPAPVLLALAQVYSMGFAPHVIYRASDSLPPKALNTYVLNIAGAGTGKSVTQNIIADVLRDTVFKNLSPDYKLNSATGLWMNAFEVHGPLQLLRSEEAESLFGKAGQKDQHLLALHTTVKTLFDQGLPGRKFRPSGQVQREIREITAPTLNMNLAATPALLQNDIGDSMMNDGFMSRVIVMIDTRKADARTEDQQVERLLALMADNENGETLDTTVAKATKFMNDSWRSGAAAHPAGREFFDFNPDDDAAALADKMFSHFEGNEMPVRYIRPPSDPVARAEFARLLVRARSQWVVPEGMIGTPAAANIDSLAVRAPTKVETLSAILSLVADPSATEINIEIARWVADVLYTAQHAFYKHILTSSNSSIASVSRSRTNPAFVGALKAATMAGGILRNGPASSSKLAGVRAWRRLIAALKQPEGCEARRAAMDSLAEIGVAWRKTGRKNMLEFYMTEGLDDG